MSVGLQRAPEDAQLKVILNETSIYYDVLALSPVATRREICSHYRELIRKYHPDNCVFHSDVARASAVSPKTTLRAFSSAAPHSSTSAGLPFHRPMSGTRGSPQFSQRGSSVPYKADKMEDQKLRKKYFKALRRIAHAHEVLSNPLKRIAYDFEYLQNEQQKNKTIHRFVNPKDSRIPVPNVWITVNPDTDSRIRCTRELEGKLMEREEMLRQFSQELRSWEEGEEAAAAES